MVPRIATQVEPVQHPSIYLSISQSIHPSAENDADLRMGSFDLNTATKDESLHSSTSMVLINIRLKKKKHII